jgi:hypothetical protein
MDASLLPFAHEERSRMNPPHYDTGDGGICAPVIVLVSAQHEVVLTALGVMCLGAMASSLLFAFYQLSS